MATTVSVEQVETSCWCGIHFMVPRDTLAHFNDSNDRKPGSVTLYCPLGHGFTVLGQRTQVRELQDQLTASRAQRDQLLARTAELSEEKRRLEAKVKRAHKGTCTECNRTFANLGRHMQTKHKTVKP